MTKKMLNETLKEIENITGGERFITYEQLEDVELIPYVYVENCGISGTGKGTLYTLYLMDEEGDKTDIELTEIVAMKDFDLDIKNDVEIYEVYEDEWISENGLWSITKNGVYMNNGESSEPVGNMQDLPDTVQRKFDELKGD